MTSISEQELLEAISPRPYGTSIDFFQLAWDIMKKELLSAVKRVPRIWNYTQGNELHS